jgi:hypothetical protein
MDCPNGCDSAVKVEAGPPGATYSSVEYRPIRLQERGQRFVCPSCRVWFELVQANSR